MRPLSSIVLILFLIIGSSFSGHHKQEYKIRTIVIDAGHGGHDSGCLGASAKEKNIALSVALKLGRLIEENFPDVKVIYTRKTDVFIPLHERADIANKNKADLFICIHCNSGSSKGAFGVETYVMGLHKTEENLAVARRENAAVLLEEDYKTQYEGFDPNSPEANIIFNLYQNQFLNQSLEFASNVQNQVVEYAGRHNRGVRQAGFLVLYKTAMPSVLIETGFLTHDTEEKYLLGEKGQNNIATCIYRAFRDYKIDTETPSGTTVKHENHIPNDADPDTVKEVPSPPKNVSLPSPVLKKEIQSVGNVEKSKTNSNDTVSAQPADRSVNEAKHEISKSAVQPPGITTVATSKIPDVSSFKTSAIYFTVQIGASTQPEKDGLSYKQVAGLKIIKSSDGYTRYVVGHFASQEAAHKKQDQLKKEGFSDCFLTAYNGDKKITVAEATELLKKNK